MAAGLIAGLAGCARQETVTEFSATLHEDAVVTYACHHEACFQPVVVGKYTFNVFYPEINTIIFDGETDFEIDSKEIYNRFKEGDEAEVSYRNVYRLVYEDFDMDGKKELVERTLTGHEFIDARPANEAR